MRTTTQRATWFAAALAALALGAPSANATSGRGFVPHSVAGSMTVTLPLISQPPVSSGRHMHWFHWHPSATALQGRAGEFGSVAVLGLESMRDLESLRDRYGFERVQAIPALHAAEVSVDPTQLRSLLVNAPSDPRIRYVAPVGSPRRLLSMPNDPLLWTINPAIGLPYEWQFGVSGVDRALDLSVGSPAIVVGTIDSGSADVPDLRGKVVSRWSISHDGTLTAIPDPDGIDETGHGTAVASLIAANVDDGFGMAGFGGATRVISIRDDMLTDASIAAGLMKLVSLGARIVNLSVGGNTPDGPILVDAIHKAAEAGVLLVAAAGNSHGGVGYPAADLQPAGGGRSFGLAVGATDVNGSLATFSNRGKHLSLVAPGNHYGMCSGVLVAVPPVTEAMDQSCFSAWMGDGGGRYAYLPGTSFSAPEVAGIAALVWAARPELKNYQVADILKQSARRNAGVAWTPTLGCGVLDAAAAVELAIGNSRTSSPAGGAACTTAGDEPAAWPPRVAAPKAVALTASGKRGTMVSLPFRVGGPGGEVAATIAVQRDGATIVNLAKAFFAAQSGLVYRLGWRAPSPRTSGTLRFCVVLSDRAGQKSASSCAPIRLR